MLFRIPIAEKIRTIILDLLYPFHKVTEIEIPIKIAKARIIIDGSKKFIFLYFVKKFKTSIKRIYTEIILTPNGGFLLFCLSFIKFNLEKQIYNTYENYDLNIIPN